MNCIITIAGDGSGRNGNPKKPRTGPVSEFLVDNSVFYIAITKHLKKCNICNIEDILRVYLKRRLDPKSKSRGRTSSGLVHRAFILEKLAAKKGNPVPRELVNEFLWRFPHVYDTHESERVLSPREKVLGYKLMLETQAVMTNTHPFENFAARWIDSSPCGKINRVLAKIAWDSMTNSKEFTDEEIELLIKTAEVLYC